ncbi:MAG: hypothetical protein H7241_10360 [Novosphingobium sp.]|nr:hypothetical protein [Novosphingobium sp.]
MTAKPLEPIDWDDFAELHEKSDGGGVFSSAMALRQASLIELVRFVASLPAADREVYVINKSGDHRFDASEIMALTHRPDYPG